MTKITQIEDRSAASAWSPIREYADVIALGAKVRQPQTNGANTTFPRHSLSLTDTCIFAYRTREV